MNDIFYLCVKLLEDLASIFGITYEEINVIIFCILGPLVFLIQWVYIFRLRKRLLKYQIQKIKASSTILD